MTHSPTTPANPAQGVSEASCVADALEACDWSGPSIGNKAILQKAVELLRSAAIGAGGQAGASPVSDDYFIQERDDDMLICAKHWQYGSICIARRPKLATNDEWRSTAQDIVNALSAIAHPVQPGWRLVPEEPTEAMLTAGSKEAVESERSPRGIWSAMLAASPAKEGRS